MKICQLCQLPIQFTQKIAHCLPDGQAVHVKCYLGSNHAKLAGLITRQRLGALKADPALATTKPGKIE